MRYLPASLRRANPYSDPPSLARDVLVEDCRRWPPPPRTSIDPASLTLQVEDQRRSRRRSSIDRLVDVQAGRAAAESQRLHGSLAIQVEDRRRRGRRYSIARSPG